MRPHQVFARMTPELAARVMAVLMEKSPATYTQALAAASSAMNARPKFLMRQPVEKRADMLRRTLARVRADPLAEEVLAAYFLEGRKELLTEWLDSVGLEHDEGILKGEEESADWLEAQLHIAKEIGSERYLAEQIHA